MANNRYGKLPTTRSALKAYILETRDMIERHELSEYEEHKRAVTIRRLQASLGD